MESASAFWTRLRWRLRGAVLWPAFAGLTLLDAVLLGRLPIAGDGGTGFVPALLLAGFANLIAVAVVGPLLGRRLRRRRADLPKVVAEDYAGTALVVAVTLALLAGGLLHRPAVVSARHDMAEQQLEARRYIARFAPAEFRVNALATDTLKLENGLFRTCAPGHDPLRWFCVIVTTGAGVPGIQVDHNRQSNASFNAPGGFR